MSVDRNDGQSLNCSLSLSMLRNVREEFEILERASEGLDKVASFIESSLHEVALSDPVLFREFPPQLRLTADAIIEKFELQAQPPANRQVDDIIRHMRRAMVPEVTWMMQKDLCAVSNLRTTLQHVISQWKLWDSEDIGLTLRLADSRTIPLIYHTLICRRHEQRYILHRFHEVVTSAFQAIQRDYDSFFAGATFGDKDLTALENVLRAIDWTPGKIHRSCLKPLIEFTLWFNRSKTALRAYAKHRDHLSGFLQISQIPSMLTATQKFEAELVVYLGCYPMLESLDNSIMHIPVIASVGAEKISGSKQVKVNNSAKRAAESSSQASGANKRRKGDNLVEPQRISSGFMLDSTDAAIIGSRRPHTRLSS